MVARIRNTILCAGDPRGNGIQILVRVSGSGLGRRGNSHFDCFLLTSNKSLHTTITTNTTTSTTSTTTSTSTATTTTTSVLTVSLHPCVPHQVGAAAGRTAPLCIPGLGRVWGRGRREGPRVPRPCPSSAGPRSGASEAEAGPAPRGAGAEDTEVGFSDAAVVWVGLALMLQRTLIITKSLLRV